MFATFTLLAGSRKFWVGTLTIVAIASTTALVALGKIPPTAYLATLAAVTTTGLGVIGSIAWEDAAQKSNPPAPAPVAIAAKEEASK